MKHKHIIAIISCDDAPGWGGEKGLCNYITNRFQLVSSDTEYVHFHAVAGSLPKQNELHKFSGFVISGSHYSVNDGYDWITNLIDFVRFLIDQPERPKLFGICFGHQLIAKALGGKVEKNSSGKFVWGTEQVEVSTSLLNEEFYKESIGIQKEHIKIMQSHGEWVSVLPKGAVCLGKSSTCSNEVLSYENMIMTTQGHPELVKDAMVKSILPRLKKNGIISEIEDKKAKETMTDEDHPMLMKFVYMFLTTA